LLKPLCLLNAFYSIVFCCNSPWSILPWNHSTYQCRSWQVFLCIWQAQYLCYNCPRRLVEEVKTRNNSPFSHQMRICFSSK
jgi:hypothetical protein